MRESSRGDRFSCYAIQKHRERKQQWQCLHCKLPRELARPPLVYATFVRAQDTKFEKIWTAKFMKKNATNSINVTGAAAWLFLTIANLTFQVLL